MRFQCNPWGFYLMWADSAWCKLILCDLRWFFVICDGSAWCNFAPSYLSRICVLRGRSAWSDWVLQDLRGSARSVMILHEPTMFGWSVMVHCDLSGFCINCDGSSISMLFLQDLTWFCVICNGSTWFEQVRRDLRWFCVI